jgi:uncharacterized damage-inducible protein DinB
MTGTLVELFRHKTWATPRLIEHCQGLADGHLVQPVATRLP